MARYIYGFELYEPQGTEANFITLSVGKDSEVFTKGDPVTVSTGSTAGQLLVAGTTSCIFGIVAKTVTMASTNTSTAKVRPSVIPTLPNYTFIGSTNSDLSSTASIGVAYKLYTASTGKSMVDVASGAQTGNAAVVVCVGVDPDREGGTGDTGGARLGLWRFVKGITANNSTT